jgi:NADPH:quinone reductase
LFELGVSVSGFTLGIWLQEHPELVRPSVERVLDLLDRGIAEPVIGRVFPAGEVAEAHAFLADRRSIGRTVVQLPMSQGE